MPALFAWLTGSDNAGSTLTFEGDEAVLAELTGILTNFEPDLAEPLTTFLGADVADNLVGVAETAFASLRSVLQGLGNAAQDTAGRSYVNSPNLSTLLNGLDDLQLRIDRLTAKVHAAEQRRGGEKRRGAEQRRSGEKRRADVRHVP
jgi:ubiquinone biosynthesis protein UbiJ